jgi:teichuronic acid biosynthesis glycosyltransferase TuaH
MTAANSDWDGLVVICAANSWDAMKMADQHMAEQMARLVPVLYVDPPMSRLTPRRNPEAAASLEGPRLRVIAPGLARLTPVVQPFPSRRGMTPVTNALLRRILTKAVARLGATPRAVVSAWPLHPVFGSCDEHVGIYWAQDDFAAGGPLFGVDATRLLAGERRTAAAADAVVAANPDVAAMWRARGHVTHLIPYGADVTAFEAVEQLATPPDVTLPRPIVGFVGHINARTDMDLLEAIAGRGRSLLLVGPYTQGFEPSRWASLLGLSNVEWVGSKPFDALPGYLGAIDVGLVPYGDTAFNRASFPLKTLEYLAAGRPVVATDLPATRWLNTGLVTMTSGADAFADSVDRWLGTTRTPAAVRERRAYAGNHSWHARAQELVGVIEAAEMCIKGGIAAPLTQ